MEYQYGNYMTDKRRSGIRLLPLEYLPKKIVLYKDTTLDTITEYYTEWPSICPKITTTFCSILIFKSFGKVMIQINCTTFMISYCTQHNLSSLRKKYFTGNAFGQSVIS